MVEYNKVNIKLTDTLVKKLQTAVKNKTAKALRMSLKMLNGNNLPHKLLLTTKQKIKLRNTFNNNMSTEIKFSKAQISKIIQSGGILRSLLSKLAGPLMKVAVTLTKNILAWLGITVAASATDAGVQRKIHSSGTTTKAVKNEASEQWGGFLGTVVGTLGSILLGSLLSGKGIVRAVSGNKNGKGIVRAGYGKEWNF